MNDNSCESWVKLKESGALSDRQCQVLALIYREGPMTGRQVSQRINGGWKRCSELVRAGGLVSLEDVHDPATNRKVALYSIPSPFPEALLPRRHEVEIVHVNDDVAQALVRGAEMALGLVSKGATITEALDGVKREAATYVYKH